MIIELIEEIFKQIQKFMVLLNKIKFIQLKVKILK